MIKIDLTNCTKISDEGIQGLAQYCSNLTSINLSVDALKTRIFTKTGLEALSRNCPGLTELNLKNCAAIKGEGVRELFLNCKGITSLNLSGLGLENKDMTVLSEFPSQLAILKSLNLSYNRGITNIQPMLGHCSELTVIGLAYCSNITDSTLTGLSGCKKLEEINIHGCHKVTIVGLTRLLKEHPALISIGISASGTPLEPVLQKIQSENLHLNIYL